MDTEVLNGSQLQSIATSSHTAGVVMSSLASRERLRAFSDITRTKTTLMKNGKRIDEEEYMKFWKDMAAAGVGNIIYGRKGKPDRFNWFYDLKTVAKAAAQGKDQEAPQLETKKTQVKKKRGKAVIRKVRQDILVQKILAVLVRPNFNLELKVPVDVTPNEIDTIIEALKQLAS